MILDSFFANIRIGGGKSKMENRKNTILLTVIAVATLLVAVVGATFAYFTAQGGNTVQQNVTVESSRTSNGSFVTYGQIAISANQENFYDGAGDLTDSATGSVTYTSSETAASQFCYNVTLNITTNTFEYTTVEETPELQFTVEKAANAANDPSFGEESTLTSPVTLITAQDITEGTTAIQIPTTAGGADYKHVIDAGANTTIRDYWRFTVTFVNLDSDQNANTDKDFNATIDFATTPCA